jgi:hypothetical protein
MRDHRAFFGKTLGMLLFFFQERFRDKEREVSVLVSGRLEHIVEGPLHLFPDRETIRLNNHTAANGRILGQVSPFDDLVVPFGIVFRPLWKSFAHNVHLPLAASRTEG